MDKKDCFAELIKQGDVFIALDPRVKGVVVPLHFKQGGSSELTLQFGFNMPKPIPDLEWDDDGVRATLSFSNSPFYCVIPWAAVYSIHNGRVGKTWNESVPPERRTRVEQTVRREPPRSRHDHSPPVSSIVLKPSPTESPKVNVLNPRSHLRLVKN